MFQLESTYQTYNGNKYLDHQINAEGLEPNFRLVGDRIPSYGIINFGAMSAGETKQLLPINNGITTDIMLRSLYSFTTNATKSETTFRLKSGTQLIGEWLFAANDMPYAFPDGAIINPNITIEIKPKNAVSQLLLYWQPVHVLSYLQV